MVALRKGGEMVTVVYLDSVFVLNTLMDYLLILATARLAGIALHRRRYWLAAILGGGYAAAVFLPELGFLAQSPVKLAVGILMALIAFGGEAKLLRLTMLLFLLSCAFAGAVLALGMLVGGVPMASGVFYTDVSPGVLLTAVTVAYLVLTVVFRASARNGVEGKLLPVRICIDGKTEGLTALWDSGNGLTDLKTGESVLVVAWEAVQGLLSWISGPQPQELETLLREVPGLCPQLLTYRSVGQSHGLLLSVRSDWVDICGRRYEGLRLALAPEPLGDGYSALWGGKLNGINGGNHEDFGMVQSTAGTNRFTSGHRDTLHRRQ